MDSLIASCKESAVQGMEYFLRNFSFVPDDKLTWTPTPTAKSAIRIAAHTALYAGRFARMIKERKLPSSDNLLEWLAQRNAEEAAITSRTEMESIFRKGTEEVIAALDSVPPEAIRTSLESGLGWSLPMTDLMNMPGWHATLHAGQIDYLQTCWGDQEVYV
ncbi:uncharacterized protein KY384_000067 [Bacidia gigantensis]|uniref:uncharacterized protein n=1 Tax=Bacidia gigantensis TaxID=2732470 RepID=UPI001D036640|nr:uncharacterized protein KY384_000067 [Bacidia gigantensis]KAG8526075.1 hypothetical protein KY384_000067 [Bacidia gigantensis]